VNIARGSSGTLIFRLLEREPTLDRKEMPLPSVRGDWRSGEIQTAESFCAPGDSAGISTERPMDDMWEIGLVVGDVINVGPLRLCVEDILGPGGRSEDRMPQGWSWCGRRADSLTSGPFVFSFEVCLMFRRISGHCAQEAACAARSGHSQCLIGADGQADTAPANRGAQGPMGGLIHSPLRRPRPEGRAGCGQGRSSRA
jgi:hypothetical protein